MKRNSDQDSQTLTRCDIDAIYDDFCEQLPPDLRKAARGLAARLGLAPDASVPWTDVFQHTVTLEAPALFARALPSASRDQMHHAVAAHMFAVIEAFGTDRLADEQVERTRQIEELLGHAKAYRDSRLVALGEAAVLAEAGRADRTTRQAIATERRLLSRRRPVTMNAYKAVSVDKQAVGFIATLSLARIVGTVPRVTERIRSILVGISLGLQIHDDVLDWRQDAELGGAWALLLARNGTSVAVDVDEAVVHSSGVLVEMLGEAVDQFELARAGASELGLTELCAWSKARAEAAREARTHEARSPGYLLRARALAPWTRAVFQ